MKTASFFISIALLALFWSPAYAQKSKILYINSYHEGFRWSDDIEMGLLKALGLEKPSPGSTTVVNGDIELRIFRMDTKLNTAEAFKQQAALAAKHIIDDWRPDVVVASDDNASKYLIAPFFKDAATPFVFCGVNWDASAYGFPFSNVTGMVEVAPILDTITALRTYARGDRIGYLGSDTTSNHKEIAHYRDILGVQYTDGQLIADFQKWKQVYLRLQDSVDLLLLLDPTTIAGWDTLQAEAFIQAYTQIPTGVISDPIIRLGLLGRVNIAEEQGWWAGKTVLRILAGTSPGEIAVVRNKQSRLYLNMKLAGRLGIKFPMDMIEKATLIEELPARVD